MRIPELLKDKEKIAVVGLGKLGLCLAAMLANKNYLVTGVDVNKSTLDLVRRNIVPHNEPGLADLLKKSDKNLMVNDDLEKASSTATVIFIVVPTPSKKDGSFSLNHILFALDGTGKGLKKNTNKFPLVVLTSTVLPGDCEKYLLPALEKKSGKKCGTDFGFCYNPEFIALGSVIHDMLNPDVVLVGEYDKRSGAILNKIYNHILENNAPVQRMNIVNAEIVKLSVNTFVTTKISYANMLTQICHQTPGADVDIVNKTLGIDSRIGIKYLKGGSPYGGPCFPRDNRAFVKMGKEKNIKTHIASATDLMNTDHTEFIFKIIVESMARSGGKNICLLGLSYKPQTWVTEESAAIYLAKKLNVQGYSVTAYDPCIGQELYSTFNNIHLVNPFEKAVAKSDMIVIMNNDKTFKKLKPGLVKKGTVILDCWRILDRKVWRTYPDLISLGIGKN